MKAFYYPLLLKQHLVRMPFGIASRMHLLLFVLSLILVKQTAWAQFGSDLGATSISTLQWKEIASSNQSDASIGLTTDGRVYTWGTNRFFTIHTQVRLNSDGPTGTNATPQYQMTPYYVPFNEPVQKVKVMGYGSISGTYPVTYMALTQSGKLYAWGLNTGLMGNAWTSIGTSSLPAETDSTKAKRVPVHLTNIGEATFVDFDAPLNGAYWVAIGASGNAYHIGNAGIVAGGSSIYSTTFTALPNPAGATGSFKYTKVWVDQRNSGSFATIYLKGNDGNIYFTGKMPNYLAGILALAPSNNPTTTTAEQYGQVLTISPRLVSFPAGEDIVKIKANGDNTVGYTTYALSASGKAYITGFWRKSNAVNSIYGSDNYVIAPLKNAPQATNINITVSGSDSTFTLEQFEEVAMPPGATKIIDIEQAKAASIQTYTIVIGDNYKAYWSGGRANANLTLWTGNSLLSVRSVPVYSDYCAINYYPALISRYSWAGEAHLYHGAAKIYNTDLETHETQIAIISKTGRGYYIGLMGANTGLGKVLVQADPQGTRFSQFPIPIANEQLLNCNTSPGTGGPLGEPVSTPGVGVIDCSKTKLYPAPVQGTPSELSLLVTINVTTVGDFSPVTISGSGMSLVSGFDKVTATTTGVQTFHIPIKYNGSTLTNNFQFTIGSAGSCSADLTNKPSNEITKVWSLNNCTAITPGVLSK